MEKFQEKKLTIRPPIVVVMGHIDHGKTKLLDAIRKTNVAEKESGGITQHIGAYEVVVSSPKSEYNNRKITFIDTPGHEAFSKMRQRGANIADIAILVVAADEGVKSQTLEALKNIQEAKIPFIVAINKIDKPDANPEKVKQQLAEAGVLLEGWGGKVPFILISATEKKNINELLELILLVADLEGLKADKSVSASGVVIETKMDHRRGGAATLIIKNGTLRIGDEVTTLTTAGKIKILENFKGEPIKEATFSSPVLVIGFKELPQIGEEFRVGDVGLSATEKTANILKTIQKDISADEKITNLILKVDVAGSLEALEALIKNLQITERKFQIISASVGDILASDIQNAEATKAWILGFRVKISKDLETLAKNIGVKIFLFDVIYDLEKFFKEEAENLISEKDVEDFGECLILACFSRRKTRQVIGGKITKGKLRKSDQVRILRNEEEIGKGKILNLQSQKKDVREVKENEETGILIDAEVAIGVGDKLVKD